MSVTEDPTDPRLQRGTVDTAPSDPDEVYLVLPKAERRKGFVRPFRNSYHHVGERPQHELRQLDADERARFAEVGYVAYEAFPEGGAILGRYWTEELLHSGCGTVTIMDRALAETYARQPKFYGSTYCVGCRRHRPVEEFIWTSDGLRVGS